MMASLLSLVAGVLSANLVLADHGTSRHSKFNWQEIKYLISFGDSYTFTQGSHGYPGYSFIGDYRDSHFSFTSEELLSDKIIQDFGGTSAAGPNWVEFLSGCATENGEWLPSQCSMQLWNFAFAGASYSPEFLEPHGNYTVPMVNQTQQYLTWADPVIGESMDKAEALVAIWIGINDIGDAAQLNVSLEQYYDAITKTLFLESVQGLYDNGFRNFLFLNVPPTDRSPGNANEGDDTKQIIRWWNDSLAKHARNFAKTHRVAKTMVYDVNTLFNAVLDDPEPYGFRNTTGICAGWDNETVLQHPERFGCTPLDTYFWLNSGHMWVTLSL